MKKLLILWVLAAGSFAFFQHSVKDSTKPANIAPMAFKTATKKAIKKQSEFQELKLEVDSILHKTDNLKRFKVASPK